MDALTFDQLPQAVASLFLKLEELERILLEKHASAGAQEDRFFTVQEAAKFLHLSVPTIYGLIQQEKIPCMKRSKRVYFSQIELTNYLKQGRKKSSADVDA